MLLCQLLLKLCILFDDCTVHLILHFIQLCSQLFIAERQHLNSKNCRILCTIDCNGCHRDAGGHLNGCQQGIQSVQGGRLNRNTDDRQGGVCCQNAAALPAAAMMTPKPFTFAFAANSLARAGVRCALMTCASTGTPKDFSLSIAGFTTGRSLSLPMMTATFFAVFSIVTVPPISLHRCFLWCNKKTLRQRPCHSIHFTHFFCCIQTSRPVLQKSARNPPEKQSKSQSDRWSNVQKQCFFSQFLPPFFLAARVSDAVSSVNIILYESNVKCKYLSDFDGKIVQVF